MSVHDQFNQLAEEARNLSGHQPDASCWCEPLVCHCTSGHSLRPRTMHQVKGDGWQSRVCIRCRALEIVYDSVNPV